MTKELEHTRGKSLDCPACKKLTSDYHKELHAMYEKRGTPKNLRQYPGVGTCKMRYYMSVGMRGN